MSLTFFSLGASVKMSGLLWAPGVAAYLLFTIGLEQTIRCMWGGILVQILVALPFRGHLWHYIHRSYQLDRQFTWFNVSHSICWSLIIDRELEIPSGGNLLFLWIFSCPAGPPHRLCWLLHFANTSAKDELRDANITLHDTILWYRILKVVALQLLHLVFSHDTLPPSACWVFDSSEICGCFMPRMGLESVARIQGT